MQRCLMPVDEEMESYAVEGLRNIGWNELKSTNFMIEVSSYK